MWAIAAMAATGWRQRGRRGPSLTHCSAAWPLAAASTAATQDTCNLIDIKKKKLNRRAVGQAFLAGNGGAGRGVYATRRAVRGEAVLAVPRSMLLNAEAACEQFPGLEELRRTLNMDDATAPFIRPCA